MGHGILLCITDLGAAGIVIPLVVIASLAFFYCGQRRAVGIWLLALLAAAGLALVSKILFIGWGIGIATIDFTGLSGHTVLATAVLPLLCGWLWAPGNAAYSKMAAGCGLLLGAAVGVSRVVLGAHSTSEVILGWLAGFVVSLLALAALKEKGHLPWPARLSGCLLLLAVAGDVANYLPTHDWETRLALLLSAREKPYTRELLVLPARPI